MTTSTDVVNRALQMLGSRTNISSLAEQSNEAFQANLVYSIVTDWAFACTNWNFARKIATLTQTAVITPPVAPGTWLTNLPQPPWLYQYSLPTDFIRAVYLTNMDANTSANFNGEPQRYVLNVNGLQTNATPAILVYTSRISDPTLWPALFERFAVASLANALAFQLSGSEEVAVRIQQMMLAYFQIAEEQNRREELMPIDTTPEWIQAIGIDYPFRRREVAQPKEPQRDNRR
jgi:hypothetical protein